MATARAADAHGERRPRCTASPRRSRSTATVTARASRRPLRPDQARLPPLGADDRHRHRLLRRVPRLRAPASPPGHRRRLRHVRGDDRPHVADQQPVQHCAATSSPRSTPARSRCTSGRASGTRIEVTEQWIKEVEDFVKRDHRRGRPPAHPVGARRDRRLVGRLHAQLRPDGRRRQDPALTPSGITRPRSTSTCCGPPSNSNPKFNKDLEFAFDAGGMVRAAMNEGKSTPISIRVTGKNQKTAHTIATAIRNEVATDRRGR